VHNNIDEHFHTLAAIKNKLGMYTQFRLVCFITAFGQNEVIFFSDYLLKLERLQENYIWHKLFILFFSAMFI
jgi:hypothetical protein